MPGGGTPGHLLQDPESVEAGRRDRGRAVPEIRRARLLDRDHAACRRCGPMSMLSTSWGGDLDTLVRQAAQRGLFQQSTFVLPLARELVAAARQGSARGRDRRRSRRPLLPASGVQGRSRVPGLHAGVPGQDRRLADLSGVPHGPGPDARCEAGLRQGARGGQRRVARHRGPWSTRWRGSNSAACRARSRSARITRVSRTRCSAPRSMSTSIDFAVLDNMMIFPAKEITTPVGKISRGMGAVRSRRS